jgi:hemerythrin-like domain-containing protein
MPVLADLFTRDLVRMFDWQERVLYPALAEGLDPAQRKHLEFLIYEHGRVRELVRRWQPALEGRGVRITGVQTLEQLLAAISQLLNRHIVFEERHVLPLFDRLPAEQQRALLQALRRTEREVMGARGQAQREALFRYLEREYIAINGRVW